MAEGMNISPVLPPDDQDIRPGPVSTKRAKERTSRVLDVALEEFIKHGYDRANLGEVARRSRVSKRTIYQICADKRELFVMVARNSMSGLHAAIDFELHNERPIRDVLRSVAELWMGSLVETPIRSLTWLIVSEVSRFPELGEMALTHIRHLRSPLGQYLLSKATPGALTEERASRMADHFLTMLMGGITGYFVPIEDFLADREQRIESALDTFLLAFPVNE
ncbi:MAG: TetR/AcrR family transcriptional regulator [Novosphingobium sp.]|nr:TetR/AcrR family transcriptional regulator [Novosphingobium sp.]